MSAFRRFERTQASEGILLLLAILVAMVWTNVAGNSYDSFWNTHLAVSFASFDASFSNREIVNEGLMAFFFLFVALEIKREILVGELASFRRASFAVFAALGEIVFPALIYLMFNFGGNTRGWCGSVSGGDPDGGRRRSVTRVGHRRCCASTWRRATSTPSTSVATTTASRWAEHHLLRQRAALPSGPAGDCGLIRTRCGFPAPYIRRLPPLRAELVSGRFVL